MSNDTVSSTRSLREQALSAVVHLACDKCGAPGKYFTDENIRRNWPGCYAEQDTLQHDTPVGNTCPNCGAHRGPTLTKKLGEIWRRRFFGKEQ